MASARHRDDRNRGRKRARVCARTAAPLLAIAALFHTALLLAGFAGSAQARTAGPVWPVEAFQQPQQQQSQQLPEWLRNLFDPVERSRTGTPRHIVIGLDLSKSNPLVDDNNFALKVADFIRTEISDLPVKSRISLRTFGVDSAAANTLRRDRRIVNSSSAEDAAGFFHTVIRNVPALVTRGTIEAQNYTNIVSFLNNMAAVVDCEEFETTIILATDGVEDSEFARLKDAGSKLPAPRAGLFEGCQELLMLGVGQGQNSPGATVRLRREWQTWSRTAGFRRFRGLNNW